MPDDWITLPSCPLCDWNESRFLFEKEGARYVRCGCCGLVYTNPAPSPEYLKRVADEWAKKHHAGEHRLVWEGNRALQHMIFGSRMARINRYRCLGKLLDVGCSTGEFLEYAVSRGWEVAGCELAEHTAEIARKRLGCEVRCATFQEAGFAESSFDVVTMWDVIEHLNDPQSALREAWRVLRPGGLLALTTPNYNSISRVSLGAKWEALIPPRHLFVFNDKTARRVISLSGGRVVETRAIDINPLDIVGGMLKRKKYGFETRQKNISAVKNLMVQKPWLNRARDGVNAALSVFNLGDVLEVYAERAP